MDKDWKRGPLPREIRRPAPAAALDWFLVSRTEGWCMQEKRMLVIPMELQGGNR